MNLVDLIASLEASVLDARVGLPEEVFQLVTRLTPMINVDLLIRNARGQTLLAWRDDPGFPTGWHVPGGIVRFKEKLETRIIKAAQRELGMAVDFDPRPLAINQIICSHMTRGHFISVLYACRLPEGYQPENGGLGERVQGYLRWHDRSPDNILKVHDMYRKYLDAPPGTAWDFECNCKEHGPL